MRAWWSKLWRLLTGPPLEPPRADTLARRFAADAADDEQVAAGTPGQTVKLAHELPVKLAITGELDLHTFRPGEVKPLVADYLTACQDAGVLSLRIVHGKGRGTLRRTVHAVLARHPAVQHYALAPPERGGWGATLVDLHAPGAPEA